MVLRQRKCSNFTSPQVSLLIRGHLGRDSIGGIGNKQRREGFTSARRVSREECSFKVNLRKNGRAEKDCCGFTQREQVVVPSRYVCVSNYTLILFIDRLSFFNLTIFTVSANQKFRSRLKYCLSLINYI